MTNEELLNYHGSTQLLTPIEKQKRFILRQATLAKPCPNCYTPVTVFRAAKIDVNDYSFGAETAEHFSCPFCRRTLVYVLQLWGGWKWMLEKEEIEAEGEGSGRGSGGGRGSANVS